MDFLPGWPEVKWLRYFCRKISKKVKLENLEIFVNYRIISENRALKSDSKYTYSCKQSDTSSNRNGGILRKIVLKIDIRTVSICLIKIFDIITLNSGLSFNESPLKLKETEFCRI